MSATGTSTHATTAGGDLDHRGSVADVAVTGMLRFSAGRWARGEVLVRNGRVLALTEDVGVIPAVRRYDVGDALVLPGIVDAHVHCLSHAGEGVAAATAAAAAGGVTTIVEMPFDATGPVNSVERLKRKRELVESQAHVDVALLGTLAPGGGWKEAEALREAGVCGFKVSLFDTDPVRFPRVSDPELLDVMRVVADTHATLAIHAENNEMVKALIEYENSVDGFDPRAHLRSRPPISERLGVVVALEMARELGTRLHLCHLSHPRAVDLVSWYVDDGADATVETCPHYLTFTAEDMVEQRGRLKINPPLRSREDRDGLWSSLIAGDVDVVASDHAPWPAEYKDHANIFANHSGVPGVETIVPVVLSAALERGQACLDATIDAMTKTPAMRFGLAPRKGELAPGADADIVVFDPSAPNVLDETRMHSNAGWSPYHGMSLKGRVAMTFSRGRVAWDGTTVLATPGSGGAVHPNV